MPTKILHKEKLIPGRTSKLVLDAPQIAATARPGHFVILRVDEKGERFPLTIADTDKEHGTITIVYLVLGRSTQMLEELEEGQYIHDVCGPLGRATNIQRFEAPKKVICVGGGTGVAAMHHIAKGHHDAGNYVIACIGARNKDLLLFEKELSLFCDEVLVSTDDGSEGRKGIVTDLVRDRLDSEGGNIAEVVAVGPVPMMGACVKAVSAYDVPVTVSLNLPHGGRHRHVRRLPRDRGRRNEVHLRGRSRIRRSPGGFCGTAQPSRLVPHAGSPGP